MLFMMTVADREDRDRRIEFLLSRMAHADMSAMGELYELIRADAYAFALSRLRRHEDAEDITHDTFVRIWQYAPAYTPMGKPMAWILTIEHNLIKQHLSRSNRAVSLDERIAGELTEDAEDGIIESEFLRELMRHLTPAEEEIIVLHVLSGLKHREIAKMLELPLSTVLSRYNRSIKKLKDIGKEEC